MITADLHIHTKYSGDCATSLDNLIDRAGQLGLGCIAICDHNTVEGALELQKIAPFTVIVAEEVLTPEGEIMGMFLKETIPGGISVEAAIRAIRSQGGLVCVPHPFDRYRSSALQKKTLERIAGDIDIVEVFNARTLPVQNLSLPRRFAAQHRLPVGAGSDAHSLAEVGRAYVEIEEFHDPVEFLKVMAKSRVFGNRTNPMIHTGRLASRIGRKLRGMH
jgi:predicted metal-dependent phosphoesterase TrpH